MKGKLASVFVNLAKGYMAIDQPRDALAALEDATALADRFAVPSPTPAASAALESISCLC